jgi:DNA-binding transcriptional regulator YiaG
MTSQKQQTPKPDEIRFARKSAGLTQTQAAALLSVTLNTWQKWEYGDFRMNKANWELFNIKIKNL